MTDYLELLEESLINKIKVLDKIGEFNLKQKDVFTTFSEKPDLEKFDQFIEEKDKLIEELNMLDDGFEALYARVAETLKSDKEGNAPRIKRLQNLIREITDKSSSLQAQEAENKKLMEAYFRNVRSGIGKDRTSLNAAYSYMQSQRGLSGTESLYMDSKK
ncbi:MAG: flagellar protein FliT [Lachnospiraceae bacterium]|nr:flagellar protein FliT [Lachnospiraceae bacterium]